MNYKEIGIKNSYISKGDNNIVNSFLNPVLLCTKSYKRSVGFFSSSVFSMISEGIIAMSNNGGIGCIKLIASPELREEDIEAIRLGYKSRKETVFGLFGNNFSEEISKLDSDSLQLLAVLISEGIMDVKIAVITGLGIYHDKLGIMTDIEGNKIVFYGSSNSSLGGYKENYEKIRLAKSWIPAFEEIVQEEEQEFDDLWNGNNPFVEIHDYTSAAQKDIVREIEKREITDYDDIPVKLRDYQNTAIEAWKHNNYKGFYVMATGTGKTWTAIFSAKELVKTHPSMIVICAPYKHLIKQWFEDVEKSFPDSNIILVSSENPLWPREITDEIIKSKFKNNQIIIISTILSFNSLRFKSIINKYDGEKLLIVDEAHRFTNRSEEIQQQYKYMLGLSATPFSGSSSAKGRKLMDFFGGQVFNLPIENALGKYLVNYYYHPIYVYSSSHEEDRFNNMTRIILGCFREGVCIDPDKLVKTLRNRLRVISMAEDKQKKLEQIIRNVKEKDHIVVYCGDGKLFDKDSGEEVKYIRSVKQTLNKLGYKPSQFTATENMKERMDLISAFNKGTITALAAIRCLDEGINIPSIKSALILSSNDDYREFVQRRGRILRKYLGKEYADIYDVIVLPSSNCMSWAQIELRRYREYSKLALNKDELELDLIDKLSNYGLTIDDVDVYDYDNMEDEQDE